MILWFSVSVQLANSRRRSHCRPETEAWEQRAGELVLVAVDEMSLVVGDPVEGQNPCVLVQVDANAPGLGRAQELLLTVVPEGEPGAGPVQAPGERVVTQTATVVGAFTGHLPVSHRHGDLSRRGKQEVREQLVFLKKRTTTNPDFGTLGPVHSTSQ